MVIYILVKYFHFVVGSGSVCVHASQEMCIIHCIYQNDDLVSSSVVLMAGKHTASKYCQKIF